MKTVSAGEIAAALGDLAGVVQGDPGRRASEPRPLSETGSGALTFARKTGAGLSDALHRLQDAIVICTDDPILDHARFPTLTLIRTSNPRLAFIRAVKAYFSPASAPPGVHPTAVIDADALVDPTASIAAFCSIGRACVIGKGCILHPLVTLYDNVRLGSNVTIHAGSVIGADGFGYERNSRGELEKFPHLGGVLVEDDVEIGSNTSIDRGTLGDTRILSGAKIDNQCHISHNVSIGSHAAIIANSMIGGSAVIGDGAWVAPSASILNQIKIGSDAVVGLSSVVVADVESGTTVIGSPAVSSQDFKAIRSAIRALTKSSAQE